VQRDLYSAFLMAHLTPQKTTPSVTQHVWEGAEPCLRAVMEGLQQRANEGQCLPPSAWVCWLLVGLPVPERVGSKVLPILNKSLLTHRCQEEALSEQQEPPRMHAGEVSVVVLMERCKSSLEACHSSSKRSAQCDLEDRIFGIARLT